MDLAYDAKMYQNKRSNNNELNFYYKVPIYSKICVNQ